MQVDWPHLSQVLTATAGAVGLRLLGAPVVWIAGRYLIGHAVRMVYFDTNRVIGDEFGAAGYPVPSTQTVMRQG